MRILVTGAAGFIGSHLAQRLCEQGHSVTGIDCFTPYYAREDKERNAAPALAAGMRLHEIDLAAGDIAPVLDGIELIYHAAAQPGISAATDFEDYLRNNVIATRRLQQAAEDLKGLVLFANLSTSSIYGADATGDETTEPRPTSHYGVTKLAAEQLVLAAQREQGFPACSFRLFSVYGPRERPEKLFPRLIRGIASGTPFPLYEGAREHRRSFTFVSDVIDALTSVVGLERPGVLAGEILNIGSDIQMTTGAAIDLVESIMGRKAVCEPRPPRPGDQLTTRADIAKARRLLGYAPRVPPEQGLRDAVAWFG